MTVLPTARPCLGYPMLRSHSRLSRCLHPAARWLLLTAVVLGAVPSDRALAQRPAVDADTLYAGWLDSQAAARAALDSVSFHEDGTWTLDGPMGARTTDWSARMTGQGGARGELERTLLALSIDGEPVPEAQWPELTDRLRQARWLDAPAFLMLSAAAGPVLERLVPAGPVHAVEQDGERLLRFEAREPHDRLPNPPRRRPPGWRGDGPPRGRGMPPVDRITLWFDADDGALRRTRLLAEPPDGSVVTITTDYRRVAGLDVPAYRTVSGVVRRQRRMRTFAVLVEAEARYTDYVVTKR